MDTDPGRTEVRRIAVAAGIDRFGHGTGRVDRDLVRTLGASGLLPSIFPDALGGTAGTAVSASALCTVREALAHVSTSAQEALALQGLGAYPIVLSGDREVAERWVPGVARGEAVAAFALSESTAGTDAGALRLRAERDGEGWRLTGHKQWISNAPDADLYTVFARTTEDVGARGVTAFLVAGDADGLTGESLEMLAPHPIGRLTFDGVAVEAVLGDVDGGFRVAMRTLDLFRPSVGAAAVGMAQAALDAAVVHARERQAFGRPIARFQAVSHRLADMAVQVTAARALVQRAADTYDGGDHTELTVRSAIAKLYSTEVAQEVIDGAVQVLGARALERGHLLEALYRDVRAMRIYEGTSEIQRTLIARALLGEERV